MVNGNHFRFDRKIPFNFLKSFFTFKLFILACTFVRIRHLRTLEFVGSPTLPPKIPEFGIRLPESGNRRWNLKNFA